MTYFSPEREAGIPMENQIAVKHWMDAREVASELGVSPKSVRQWVKDGKLGATKVGRLLRINRSHLIAFIAENATRPADRSMAA